MDTSKDKARLREQMRTLRKAIAPDKRSTDEAALENRLFSLPALKRVKCIAVYSPIGSELRFASSLDRLFQLEQGPTIAFPIVRSEASMSFYRFEANDDRSILAQPTKRVVDIDSSRHIEPTQIDVMLIPGIAFDEKGHRLGQGGGYYDRYLPYVRKDCMLIGVAFDEQIIDSVPVNSTDMPVNYVITPTRLISAR